MRILPRILPLKIIAVILFIASFGCAIAFGAGFAYAVTGGYFEYPQAEDYLHSEQLKNETDDALKTAAQSASDRDALRDALIKATRDTNFVFTLRSGEETLFTSSDAPTYPETHTEFPLPDGNVLSAELMQSPTVRNNVYYDYYIYDFVYSARYGFCIVTVSCLAAALFFGYFIMCGAGRRRKSNEIHLNMADRLPLDLYALLIFAGMFVSGWLAVRLLREMALWTLFLIIPCLLLISSLTAALLDTVAKRVKNGTWWDEMLTKKLVGFTWGLLCHAAGDIEKVFISLPLIWKALIMSSLYLCITLLTLNGKSGVLTVLWLIVSVIAIIAICLAVISADKIRQGAKKLAQGDLSYRIDTDDMLPVFRQHANNLNSINDVLARAVEERTRNEKFKAELITNVSHDIKTPITSIINYVDLLGRENLTDEQRAQYLDVLKRQSARLKKLTVDLVEASKASTGNISVQTEPLDVCEILKQSTGEFSERIADSSLALELQLTDGPLMIMADGRLLWRVFENLLSNICKYSQPGTRVYVTTRVENGCVVTDFKNISRERLSIPGKDLAERFVRGDSSRSTEGSGLGLSIAKSFTELQGGTFDIITDGDLFKAEIRFPIVCVTAAG